MASTSASSSSWWASISARARRSPVRSRKRATARPPTVRPLTSRSRPALVASVKPKGSPRSRSLSTARSRRPADSGLSQVPKARKAARSAGAPEEPESLPATSAGSRRRTPGDHPLVLVVDERLGAVSGGLGVGKLELERDVLGLGTIARPDQRDRRDDGEGDRADQGAEEDDLSRAQFADEQGGCPFGSRGGQRSAQPSRENSEAAIDPNRDRLPAMPSHATGPLPPHPQTQRDSSTAPRDG